MNESGILGLAYLMDLIWGDPKQLPHPIRGIGWCIEKGEQIVRTSMIASAHKTETEPHLMESRERLAGVCLAVGIPALTYILFSAIQLAILRSYTSIIFSSVSVIVLVYLTSSTIATRGLLDAGRAVIDEVRAGSIPEARKRVSMIVGRDTASLDRKGILRAAIETLSENASDGIIAPLFYFALGGLPLAMTYKAINTLDSMVGYRNETYRNLGWASARLDDIANYVPARITGFLIIASTFILSRTGAARNCLDAVNAFRTMMRDGRKHASPNSGVPEAAMAGALGVQLGGPSTYGGIVSQKPFIGEEQTEISGEVQDSSGTGRGDYYLHASEKALLIVKIASAMGLCGALIMLYLKKQIGIPF
jgi:adenosylcobinamide-phosphate synthase